MTEKRRRGRPTIMLTEEQIAWYVENYPNMSNKELNAQLGVSKYKTEPLTKQYGLMKSAEYMQRVREKAAVSIREAHRRRPWMKKGQLNCPRWVLGRRRILNEEQVEWLKANYATTQNCVIREKFGISQTCLNKYRQRYNLHKSVEHMRAMHDLVAQVGAITTAKKRASERRRLLFGLPQLTKMAVHKQNPTHKAQRYKLKKAGYIIDEDKRIAYYTDATNRLMKTELKGQPWYKYQPLNNEAV